MIADHGSIPLLYWSPWGPPYEQGQHVAHDPWSLQRIIAGDCDAYIDKWAAGAKEFGRPIFVSFACEANSDWFPWSGHDNGGEHGGAEVYRNACRHAVDRVRADGVTNIAWVFHANSSSHPERRWNSMSEYYPGAGYVDWLGISVYGQITPGRDSWDTWSDAMDVAYQRLTALDPDKPVMLAEWGVGEFPNSGDKADFIRDAFAALSGGKYPRMKAAVFWHERWQNKDESWSNLRVNSSPGALRAYRDGVGRSFWLGSVGGSPR